MIEIFHVSDLHFGGLGNQTKKSKFFLEKMDEKFEISTAENKYLLVTGDITQTGTSQNLKTALKALERFKDRIYFVPGNHDYGDMLGFFYDEKKAKNFDEIFAKSLSDEQRFFNKEDTPFIKLLKENETNKILLIGLNSPLKISMGSSLGLIGYHQLKRVNDALSSNEYKNVKKILYLHHIPNKPADEFYMDLIDWDDLMKVVKGRVNILAFGHEGPMKEIKTKSLKERLTSLRTMEVREGRPEEGIDYFLDANQSVMDSSCYYIKVENGDITSVKKEQVPKK